MVTEGVMRECTYQVISEQCSHIVGVQLDRLAEVFLRNFHVTLCVFDLQRQLTNLPFTNNKFHHHKQKAQLSQT